MKKFLIINIGGSSSKIGIAEDRTIVSTKTIRYSASELKNCGNLWGQLDLRLADIRAYLVEQRIDESSLTGIITRGPLVKPIPKGAYQVNVEMVTDAKSGQYGQHPCSLGSEIGLLLGDGKLPVYTVDAPCSDELISEARYTGLPFIKRKSYYQVLNHHAVARSYAERIGTTYEKLNLVITHLGSGVSVASHRLGQVIDVTNGLEGDGPMGLDRTGTIPGKDLLKASLSKEHSPEQLLDYLDGQGGIKAYLDTIDGQEVEKMIAAGNEEAKAIYHAMAFQVAKGIGAAAAALGNKPDAVLITGGLANSQYFTDLVKKRTNWIAPIEIMKEENELAALLIGVLEGLEQNKILEYK